MARGYKLGLLTTADYNNISQCETLDDIKLYLVGAVRRGWTACGGGYVYVGWLSETGLKCRLP